MRSCALVSSGPGIIDFPQLILPNSQINVQPQGAVDGETTRGMNVQPILGENPENLDGSIIASEAFIKLHPVTGQPLKEGTQPSEEGEIAGEGDAYYLTDKDGKLLKGMYLARGAYVVQLLEAVYPDQDDTTQTPIDWQLLDITQYCDDDTVDQQLKEHALHEAVTIPLKGLRADWEYKIQMFGVADEALEGKDEIKVPGDGELLKPGDGITQLAEYTQRTVGTNGILIDKKEMDFEQVDQSQVNVIIYNAVGLDKVKTIRCSFMPKGGSNSVENLVDTGYLPLTDAMKKTDKLTDGTERTTITIPVSFNAAGTYVVVANLYGEDVNAEPLVSISSHEGKYLKVTHLPPSMTSRLPVSGRLEALLPDKKRRMGKEKTNA